jgi:hypothetical protein
LLSFSRIIRIEAAEHDVERTSTNSTSCRIRSVRHLALPYLRSQSSCRNKLASPSRPAYLPAARQRLAVTAPAGIARAKGERRHTEDEGVDAPIAMTRCGTDQGGAPRGDGRIPWLTPRCNAGFEGRDDFVSQFLIMIAPLRESLRCSVPWAAPYWAGLSSKQPSHGPRRGKGGAGDLRRLTPGRLQKQSSPKAALSLGRKRQTRASAGTRCFAAAMASLKIFGLM